MTSPALKRYRVFMHEWILWDAFVEAASEEEAQSMAQAMWDADGQDAFCLFNNGNDGATAEEC